jgi:hypothetical protein
MDFAIRLRGLAPSVSEHSIYERFRKGPDFGSPRTDKGLDGQVTANPVFEEQRQRGVAVGGRIPSGWPTTLELAKSSD